MHSLAVLLAVAATGALLGSPLAVWRPARIGVTRGRPQMALRMLEPRQLTTELTQANSSAMLIVLWDSYRTEFNTLHISAFWNRLGKLIRFSRTEQNWLRANGPSLAPVRAQTLVMLPQLEARSLCNTAHGLASARLSNRPPWTEVF